jgi:hypothetical protein
VKFCEGTDRVPCLSTTLIYLSHETSVSPYPTELKVCTSFDLFGAIINCIFRRDMCCVAAVTWLRPPNGISLRVGDERATCLCHIQRTGRRNLGDLFCRYNTCNTGEGFHLRDDRNDCVLRSLTYALNRAPFCHPVGGIFSRCILESSEACRRHPHFDACSSPIVLKLAYLSWHASGP